MAKSYEAIKANIQTTVVENTNQDISATEIQGILIDILDYSKDNADSGPAPGSAPTLVSAVVNNSTPNQVTLLFSKVVTVSSYVGFFIPTRTIQSISGNGTNTLTLTLAADVGFGDELNLNYDAATGNVEDLDGNDLATITAFAITNNIISSEFFANLVNASQSDNNLTSTAASAQAVMTQKLVKASGGSVKMVVSGSSNYTAVLGVMATGGIATSGELNLGVYINGSGVIKAKVIGGDVGSENYPGGSLYMRLRWDGSVVYAEHSTDDISYTLITTWAYTGDDLYPKAWISQAGKTLANVTITNGVPV